MLPKNLQHKIPYITNLFEFILIKLNDFLKIKQFSFIFFLYMRGSVLNL